MIINQTQNIIISQQEKHYKSHFFQAIGLMFRPRQNLILEFPTERSISLHTFFVFYPIEVLILDEHLTIVEIKPYFKPWRMWTAQRKGKYVIELAQDHPHISRIGDKIKITP